MSLEGGVGIVNIAKFHLGDWGSLKSAKIFLQPLFKLPQIHNNQLRIQIISKLTDSSFWSITRTNFKKHNCEENNWYDRRKDVRVEKGSDAK